MAQATRTMTVKGKGSAKKAPDVFGVRFKAQGYDDDYGQAVEESNRVLAKIRKAIARAGIDPKELKSTDFGVRRHQVYNRDTEEYDYLGYWATHNLKIEIPHQQKMENKLMKVISEGTLDPDLKVYFAVSNVEELKEQMLCDAVRNAKRRAELIAQAAGVKLQDILSINYSWGEIRFSRQFCEMSPSVGESSAPSPDFEPEDIEESDTVEVVFEIA